MPQSQASSPKEAVFAQLLSVLGRSRTPSRSPASGAYCMTRCRVSARTSPKKQPDQRGLSRRCKSRYGSLRSCQLLNPAGATWSRAAINHGVWPESQWTTQSMKRGLCQKEAVRRGTFDMDAGVACEGIHADKG